MEQQRFIQVGMTAMRDPDGNFLPAVPLYIEATPENIQSEGKLIQDIGRLFAQRMGRYIEANEKAGFAL